MISIKGGTKTWSDAKQESALKSDPTQQMSKDELQKHYGVDNIGDALNKVADANWTKPTARKVGNANLDKDAFLKLFLAQLKHQDPTNPMESHEMAAQLAQFTSLEKLEGIEGGIQVMNKQTDPAQSFDTLKLIGKAVSGDASKVIRTDTGDKHDINFKLKNQASSAKIIIFDRIGQITKEFEVKDLKEGKNKIVWDGMDKHDRKAPEGEYRIIIEAHGSNGKKLHADTKFQGVVTGVNFTAEGPVLMVGNQSIKMSEINKIYEPDKGALTQAHQAKATEVKSDEQDTGNLDKVGMSRGLINKLAKETGGVKGVN